MTDRQRNRETEKQTFAFVQSLLGTENEHEVITIANVESDRPHAGEVLLVEVVGDGFCSPGGVNLDTQALCKKGTKI